MRLFCIQTHSYFLQAVSFYVNYKYTITDIIPNTFYFRNTKYRRVMQKFRSRLLGDSNWYESNKFRFPRMATHRVKTVQPPSWAGLRSILGRTSNQAWTGTPMPRSCSDNAEWEESYAYTTINTILATRCTTAHLSSECYLSGSFLRRTKKDASPLHSSWQDLLQLDTRFIRPFPTISMMN